MVFNIRLLSKSHFVAKTALFAIFVAKFFDHVATHALKILQQICRKMANFINQSGFRKKSIEPLLNLIYPPLCIHCHHRLSKRGVLFCQLCLEQIALIELKEKCRCCFADLYKGRCERCIKRPVIIQRQIAACEAIGPAKALLVSMQSGRKDCISAIASLMAYQWLELKIPFPHFLIPLPISFWKKQSVGFDVNLLLAHKLSQILSIPLKVLFKKKFDCEHFLQKGEFRSDLHLVAKLESDQRILLIDPVLEDSSLRSAGQALKIFSPTQIYALSFVDLIK